MTFTFTPRVDGVDDVMAADINELQTAITALSVIDNAWVEVAETWTRTGNHTFTIPTDLTARYGKGVKVRYKDGGAFEYGVIASSAYAAPSTTVTLITNADYAMAVATITDAAISRAETPEGFPDWFSWTPTLGGFSADPAGGIYRWGTNGRSITLAVRHPASGTSNSVSLTISAPVVAATITGMVWRGESTVTDDGVVLSTTGVILLGSASSSVEVWKNAAGAGAGNFTASGAKRANVGTITYEF